MISSTHIMNLQETWMRLNGKPTSMIGPKVTCDIIHPGSLCIVEIVKKCATVLKQSSRLYLILYTMMFLLKAKKIRREGKFKKCLVTMGKDFLGSLVFMSWLVGGMKAALCTLNALQLPLDSKYWSSLVRITPFLSLLGSPSLYFIEKSRRSEVSYFVFVRALRSFYIFTKKRVPIPINCEKTLCFVLIFGIISYLYYEGPKDLKHRHFIDSLWGEAWYLSMFSFIPHHTETSSIIYIIIPMLNSIQN